MPAPAAQTPSAEIAGRIARGDRRGAAAVLVREHAPAVFALCRAMVRDARLAEDLSQDAFARAIGALDGFRGEASPRTWLLAIARNRCLDHLGRARRAPWAGHDDAEPDAHAADEPPPFDLLARREDAERAMAALGESERALVVLHFGHGVGYPELADSFGLREGAVRMRISRALAKMRAALREDLLREEATLDLAEAEAGAEAFEDLETAVGMDSGRRRGRGALDDEDDDLAADFSVDFSRRSARAAPAASAATQAPTFDTLRDPVPPGLWARLDALARAV